MIPVKTGLLQSEEWAGKKSAKWSNQWSRSPLSLLFTLSCWTSICNSSWGWKIWRETWVGKCLTTSNTEKWTSLTPTTRCHDYHCHCSHHPAGLALIHGERLERLELANRLRDVIVLNPDPCYWFQSLTSCQTPSISPQNQRQVPSCLLGIPNCSEWQWLSVARPRFLSLLGLLGLVTKYVSKPIHKPWGQDIGIAIVFLIWGLVEEFQTMFPLEKVAWWKVIAKSNFKKQLQEQFQQDS